LVGCMDPAVADSVEANSVKTEVPRGIGDA
jgi:hypothetical protein